MLSYFKIRNFKSILDVTVDFSYAEGKAPNNYEQLNTIPFLEVDKKNRFVPCMAFYGANASGKSNIVMALLVLNQILHKGIIGHFFPNKLNPKYNYSSFEIEFFKDKTKYTYYIEYNLNSILKEKLLKNNETLYSIDKSSKNNFKNIQTEDYNADKFNNIIDVECSQFQNFEFNEPILNENKKLQIFPFLSRINFGYKGLNKDLVDAFNYLISSIVISLTNNIPYRDSLAILSNHKNDNESLQQSFNKIADILKKFDIDITRISINRELKNPQERLTDIPAFVEQNINNNILRLEYINSYHHDINNREVKFNFFREESNGTQILLSLIGFVLYSLENGAALIIDEIDRAIHPMILIQIIKMFKDKDYNKKNAQLIFTCHATDILSEEIFRISEVSFISKNLKDGSTTKRISDFKDKDIRNVTDFRKLYWNGVFGGIPYPYI